MKKAQISIFVIIGILILFGVLISYNLMNNSKSNELDLEIENTNPININSFKSQVESCLESVSNDAIYEVALTGGFDSLENNVIDYYSIKIPIYLSNYQVLFPSLKIVENSMSSYFNSHLIECIDNLNQTNLDKYLSYNKDIIESSFKIYDGYVDSEVKFEFSILEDDKSTFYNNFKYSHNVNYLRLHELSNQFLDLQMKNPDYILSSQIVDFSSNHDIKIELINFDSDTIIYSFILEEFEKELVYNFAIKYAWEEIQI